jgi:predicted RNase H-like HicB family nuclease
MKKQITNKSATSVEVQIDIILVKEGEYYVALCPSLNVSSYGETQKEAKSAFDEALKIFISETDKNGNLEKELLKNGWVLQQQPKPSYKPPRLSVFPDAAAYKKSKLKFKEKIAIPL